MLFCVFSFNRGRFLRNCIDSIERCAPDARIAVFDDNSYDEDTLVVLKQLSARYPVMGSAGGHSRKLGGLYGNMQAAMEYAGNEELVCFLQDDMQLVRRVSGEELAQLRSVFATHPALAFLQPCFLKGSNRQRDQESLVLDSETGCYFRNGGRQSAGLYFSAVSVFIPRRLMEAGWHFDSSEPLNDLQARKHFGPIGHLAMPFAMYLPDVPAYRGKVKTLALRIAEKVTNVGYYPFRTMTDDEANAFLQRSLDVLPVAEDFLTCLDGNPKKPWVYYALQGRPILKKLNVAELALRRWFRPG